MNPEDAIARLRAKASAVERANRQAEKAAASTTAATSNRRNQCNSLCNVKSVEHVIADLSAKASMVEILSLTAAELEEQSSYIHSTCMSPTCRPHASRPPASPRLPSVSPQSSPRTPLPHRTPPNPGRISLSSPRIISPQPPKEESLRLLSPVSKPASKAKLRSEYSLTSPRHDLTTSPRLTSPRHHDLSTLRQYTPRQHDLGSSRGRSMLRESLGLSPGSSSFNSTKTQPQPHPLCLQGRTNGYQCSCHCVSTVFQEPTTPHTPSSTQRVKFSSSPRYYSVAERGFEDMDLVALSPPAWRKELAPDLVQVRSQDRISPITIPSIIGDAAADNENEDDACYPSRSYGHRKRDGKTRNSEHRRMTVIH